MATLVGASIVSLPTPAGAQAPSAPPNATNAAADLRYFVGAWSITAKDPRTGEAEAFSYKVEPTLGGSWITGAGASLKGDYAARDMWSRDAASGAMTRIVFTAGGGYAVLRSEGWKGDTLVFTSQAQSAAAAPQVRQTITRMGPNEFRAVWEMSRDGVWTAYSDERVVRSGPSAT